MSWDFDMVQMLRVLINDISPPQKYTNTRLTEILAVAANYVQSEISFPQKYNISLPAKISPDPTLLSTPDVDFISFTVLKAACLIDKSLATNAALSGNLSAKAGESKLSLKSKIKNYKELVRIGNCSKYEKMKAEYAYHSLENALSVMTPFVDIISDDFVPDVIQDPIVPVEPDIPGDFSFVLVANQVINERSLLDLSNGQLGTITFSDSRDTFYGTVNWGDGYIDQLSIEYHTGYAYLSGSHTYQTDGSYIVTVTISDDDGGVLSKAFAVTATNIDIPGDFTVSLHPNVTIDENELLDLTGGLLGSFTYDDITDTHTAVIDWGDGTVENVTVVESDGSGTLSASHNYGYITYADSGNRIVTVTITDDSGGVVTSSFIVTILNIDIPFVPLPYGIADMLDIEEYGALPNENITAILQFALENTSHNGTVYIPNATYYITDTIIISGYGGGIYGGGYMANLVWAGPINKPMFKILGSGFSIDGSLRLTGQNSGIDDNICKTAIEIESGAEDISSMVSIRNLAIEKFYNGIDVVDANDGHTYIRTLEVSDIYNSAVIVRDNSGFQVTLLEVRDNVQNVFLIEDESIIYVENSGVYGPTNYFTISDSMVDGAKPMFSVDMMGVITDTDGFKCCDFDKAGCYPYIVFGNLNILDENSEYLFGITADSILLIQDSLNIQAGSIKVYDGESTAPIYLDRVGIGVLSSMGDLVDSESTGDYLISTDNCFDTETFVPIEDYKGI